MGSKMALTQDIQTHEVTSRNLRPLSKILSFTLWKWFVMPVFVITLQVLPVQAGENRVGVGLGIFTLAGYQDFQIIYHPDHSHWLYGYRYISGTERFEDPWTGNPLTDTTDTKSGPMVFYLFNNEADKTFYLGASLFKWSLTDTSLVTGESDTDSTVAPFFGGGYFGWLGTQGYYNIGVFLGLGAKLTTQTSVSTEEDEGVDLQMQIGIAF